MGYNSRRRDYGYHYPAALMFISRPSRRVPDDVGFKERKLFKLITLPIKLITLPISLVLKLVRLPFTIMGCIAKLGCLVLVAGVVAGVVAVLVYT